MLVVDFRQILNAFEFFDCRRVVLLKLSDTLHFLLCVVFFAVNDRYGDSFGVEPARSANTMQVVLSVRVHQSVFVDDERDV